MKKLPLFSLVLLLASSAFLSACDFTAAKEAFDDFNIVIGIDNQKTAVVVQLFDARTGEFVSRQATVEFLGDPALFVDTYGDPLVRLRTSSGQAGFSISDARMPTSSRPAEFDIRVTAEGYLSASRTFAIADTGAYVFQFQLVDPTSPPPGTIAARTSTQTNAQGQTPSRTVVTPPPSTTAPTAGADIPAGTVMTSSTGQPVSGNLNIDVVAVDPENGAAMNTLPQSRAALRKANDLNLEDYLIYAALQLDIQTAAGINVLLAQAPVGQNIDVEFVLPRELADLASGLPLASGATFIVGRFNPTTFTWENYAQATYQGASGPNTRAKILIRRNQIASGTYVILAPISSFENVRVDITRNGHQSVSTTFFQSFVQPFTFTFPNSAAPALSITRRMPVPGRGTRSVAVASDKAIDVQSGASNAFTFTLPAPTNPNITFQMNLVCPAGQGVFLSNLPSLTISYREAGTTQWFNLGDISRNPGLSIVRERQGDVTSRILSLRFVSNLLVQGRTYNFEGVYNGTDSYRERHTINANPFTLNWEAGTVCR